MSHLIPGNDRLLFQLSYSALEALVSRLPSALCPRRGCGDLLYDNFMYLLLPRCRPCYVGRARQGRHLSLCPVCLPAALTLPPPLFYNLPFICLASALPCILYTFPTPLYCVIPFYLYSPLYPLCIFLASLLPISLFISLLPSFSILPACILPLLSLYFDYLSLSLSLSLSLH